MTTDQLLAIIAIVSVPASMIVGWLIIRMLSSERTAGIMEVRVKALEERQAASDKILETLRSDVTQIKSDTAQLLRMSQEDVQDRKTRQKEKDDELRALNEERRQELRHRGDDKPKGG